MANFLDSPKESTSSISCTSSAGQPRNKVALLPGYSLMDWIKLGKSGQDLTSVGGVLRDVTEEELLLHSTEKDAWISIRGKVYNITPYLGFHPGGIPELMRGAGKDATQLFTEIHPWVNYESILSKCLVGRLVKSKNSVNTNSDLESAFSDLLDMVDDTEFDSGCVEPSVFDSDIKMRWCQTQTTLKFFFYCKVSSPHVLVLLKDERHVRVLIKKRKKLHVFGFTLQKKVVWPCNLSMNTDTGRLEVDFEKKELDIWQNYGVDDADSAMVAATVDEIEAYHSAEIISINQVTHNVRIFVLKFLEKIMLWLPIGHDLRIRGIIHGIDYAKQYTPIPPHLPHGVQTIKHWHNHYLCFMVKCYSEGALTPYLFSKEEHDTLEVGGMSGTFNIRKLRNVRELYMIAAGSGLSPMLRLIVWGVSKRHQVKAMNLLFVNRYEEDIIWRKELNELSKKEKWFKVTYCLSQPPENWTGLRGRVDGQLLDEFLPVGNVMPGQLPEFFIVACGPINFTEMVQKYLGDRGYGPWSHCFIG